MIINTNTPADKATAVSAPSEVIAEFRSLAFDAKRAAEDAVAAVQDAMLATTGLCDFYEELQQTDYRASLAVAGFVDWVEYVQPDLEQAEACLGKAASGLEAGIAVDAPDDPGGETEDDEEEDDEDGAAPAAAAAD